VSRPDDHTNATHDGDPATPGPLVAVVGGGIAGLAAAHHLLDAGANVVVLEADRFGGKLRTSTFAGRPVDEGADAFLARVPFATDLARRVGLADRLVAPVRGDARIVVDDALVPLPAGHVLGVPTDPEASDLAAILTPEGLAALRRDLEAPGPPPPADGDESIGGFIRRRLGDEALERLVGPLVGGINAGDVDALSLAAVTPQIDALARSAQTPSLVAAAAAAAKAAQAKAQAHDFTAPPPNLHRSPAQGGDSVRIPSGSGPAPVFLAPIGGMVTFVDAVVDDLHARGATLLDGVVVRSLERLAQGWRVVADHSRGAGVSTDSTFEVDAVVLAAPAPLTALIIQDHAPTAGMHLASIPHASVALVTFAFEPDALAGPLDGSGFLVPRTAGRILTAASWSSSKWAALAPDRGDGTVLVRASAGRADDRRIAELDDDALGARLVADLAATMGVVGDPSAVRVRRWPSSFPQYRVGHLQLVDELEADLVQHAPTLAVAGNALRGVGIPASIRSGQVAAERVLTALLSSSKFGGFGG
jgi:oxygen-dependent protoporphyrinogen oxidase